MFVCVLVGRCVYVYRMFFRAGYLRWLDRLLCWRCLGGFDFLGCGFGMGIEGFSCNIMYLLSRLNESY